MPADKYNHVGVRLEFTINELDNIKAKHLNDTVAALVEVFNKWNNKQEGTGRKRKLVRVLRQCELNDQAKKLLDGEFLPQGTCTHYFSSAIKKKSKCSSL